MASIGPLALGAKGCAERLHRFAQGAADWRTGPRWSIISVLCPVHPFPLRGTSPQGETRDMERKTGRHILHVPFRRLPPLVAGATTFPPLRGGTITRAYCRAICEESVSRCFILPPLAGEVRRSRIGGGERSEPVSRIVFMSYDTESNSRNADFISIAAERQSATFSAAGAVAP